MARWWKEAAILAGFVSAIDINGEMSYWDFRELQRHAYQEPLRIGWDRGTYAPWEYDWNMVGIYLRLAINEHRKMSMEQTDEHQ
jgi:hypothetical protein